MGLMPTAHPPGQQDGGGSNEGGGASGDDPLGSIVIVSVASVLQLPISVEGSFVCGLVAPDVVIDSVRSWATPTRSCALSTTWRRTH